MPRDKTPVNPDAMKAMHVAQAREAIKRADREISLRPSATSTPMIRDLRNWIAKLIGEVERA